MLRILYNLTCTVRIRKDVWFQPLQRCSTKVRSNVENDAGQKWFSEKEDEILQIVNESNVKELSKYIQSSYAETIISNRTNNGPYKSLNDLVSQNKLTSDNLNNFYTLIINHKVKKRKWKKFVVTPDVKTIMMPKTILGIHVGSNAITWTLLNCDFKILDWDCLCWHNQTTDINTFNLINLASSIAQTLPVSSCYVIEELKMTNKSLYHMLSIQQQLNIAIMSCLKLMENQRRNNSMEPKNSVYVLQYLTSARFLNLIVGNEVIAAKYIMKLILNNEAIDNKGLQFVHVDDELKKKFTARSLEQQEQIGWSVAKAITFIRLVIIFNVNLIYRESD
ncbi:uncharacterized protein LOC143424913 [Xylocopa sonorina]|uniref:uncharacterized protein LOC143424913 n=1 Tax=Xylocopa sonorina TaxID=1818115 RepID=UPI00403AE347